MLDVEIQEMLINDLKKKIKKDVIATCDKYKIDEANVNYDLKLQLTFNIRDEIKKEI